MVDGEIHVDNLKEFAEKRLNKESGLSAEKIEMMKKCVEDGKQKLNWIGKNLLNILNNS
jgi:5-bromo-4-chloroindolyl phosphate hydrolysis protein